MCECFLVCVNWFDGGLSFPEHSEMGVSFSSQMLQKEVRTMPKYLVVFWLNVMLGHILKSIRIYPLDFSCHWRNVILIPMGFTCHFWKDLQSVVINPVKNWYWMLVRFSDLRMEERGLLSLNYYNFQWCTVEINWY